MSYVIIIKEFMFECHMFIGCYKFTYMNEAIIIHTYIHIYKTITIHFEL